MHMATQVQSKYRRVAAARVVHRLLPAPRPKGICVLQRRLQNACLHGAHMKQAPYGHLQQPPHGLAAETEV